MTASPSLAELVGETSERTPSRLSGDEPEMGCTARRTQLRLHRAVLLLAEGRTVTQAAAICGFSSPSAFASAFRAAFGRTPESLYRWPASRERRPSRSRGPLRTRCVDAENQDLDGHPNQSPGVRFRSFTRLPSSNRLNAWTRRSADQ
ncbi:helix-turn-helix domain-containing protein [Streptomyces antibioticus]|uniref:helix-turn-helix domain-containing protein n=1 Tax=Streptomyces antibioticus TaxID=1890 RepID=UPI0033E4CD69